MSEFTFKVIDKEWKIIFVDSIDDRLNINGRQCWGATNPNTYTISIDKNATIQRLKEVVKHEIVHAIIRTASIKVYEDSSKEYLNEEDVANFIGAWGEFICDTSFNAINWLEDHYRD